MIAMFSHGAFFAMPTFSQRVQQENVIGLVLRHVTEGDSGNYSSEVIVRDRSTGATTTMRHTAELIVYSHSKAIADATVSVTQEADAVWDNSTGQYHVSLSCLYHGRQPPAVTWTLPSGATQVVWTSEGGKFSLLVPNPVSGGNYTCSVHPHTPATRCLPTDSPVLRGDTLYLDRVEARLTLLETEQQALKIENSQQVTSIRNLQAENQKLLDMASKRVAFHARMFSGSVIHVQAVERLVLTDVVCNQGNGYNTSTGYFTAPYNGTYTFLATLCAWRTNNKAGVYIVVDGTRVNWCEPDNTGDSHACDAVVHLNAGQGVWVEGVVEGYFAVWGTALSGFLVSPDP